MNDQLALSSQLKAAEGYLLYLERGATVALNALQGSSDPHVLESRLRVLIEDGQLAQARQLVDEQPIHLQWSALALLVIGRQGDFAKAEEVLAWIQQQRDTRLRRQCAVAFASAAYAFAAEVSGGEGNLFPALITEQGLTALRKALYALEPVLRSVEANQGVESLLEASAVAIALVAAHCIDEPTAAEKYARLLAQHQPIPLDLALAVLRRGVSLSPDITDRLRSEHIDGPEAFDAQLLAALIETKMLGKPAQGLSAALGMVTDATTAERRQKLLEALREIAGSVDKEAVRLVESLGPVLAKDDDRLKGLLSAEALLRRGSTSEAGAMLEQLKRQDDPVWLQLYASYLMQSGRKADALAHFRLASERLPHPSLLRQMAMIADSEGDADDAQDLLRRAVAMDPGNNETRELLAMVLTRNGAFRQAAQELEDLVRRDPENVRYQTNLAVALVHAGDTREALRTYDRLCERNDPPLAAVLGRAAVLKSVGQVKEAFQGLLGRRGNYWSEVDFLTAFMDVGFAAGEEKLAHDAFVELIRLKKEGVLPSGVLEEASLDDIKAHVSSYQARRRQLHDDLLTGKVPWLFVDRILGKASYWAWGVRTQSLGWIFEQRLNQAEFTVYATNGYRVFKDETAGEIDLVETQCPVAGSSVVVDWTALITLHRLGFLEAATKYFGRLCIPASYRMRAFEEAGKLVPHQLSDPRAIEAIANSVEDGDVTILDRQSPDAPTLHLDEYDPESRKRLSSVGFREVFQTLFETGLLTRDEFERVSAAARGDEQVVGLQTGDQLLAALSSLEGLSRLGVLEIVTRSFRVYLDPDAIHEMRGRRRVLRFQEQVRSFHNELWQFVGSNTSFAEIPVNTKRVAGDDELRDEPAIEALRVATTAELPLFADDRFCQSAALNMRSTVKDAAFGTADFLRALQGQEGSDLTQIANAWHQLLVWRYRFLLPPSEVVHQWAGEYRENLPGDKLRDVARYCHEAVADPGLFAGHEPTTSPSSVAIRYYQEWIGIVAESIVQVWSDTSFTDVAAELFTSWAVTRLIPPPPANLGPRDQGVVSRLLAKSLIGRLGIYATAMKNPARARAALLSASQSLTISSRALERIIVDTIDAI